MTKQLELKRIRVPHASEFSEEDALAFVDGIEEGAQSQLQDDQQVLDNVKQAIFEEFAEIVRGAPLRTDARQTLAIILYKLRALKKKWLK